MATNRVSPVSFLKLAADVSSFYGFRPVREVEKRALLLSKDNRPKTTSRSHTFASTASLATACVAHDEHEPVLVFYATPSPTHPPHGFSLRDMGEFGLQIIGTSESVSEIILLQTIATILLEWGVSLKSVRINALGDKDSRERFTRELIIHIKKNANRLPSQMYPLLEKDPSLLYHLEEEEARAVANEAPRSITFLSEKSRLHFRSILEYLEQLGFPYELDGSLIGDERAHHTAFAVDLESEDATIAHIVGGRYDDHLKLYSRKPGSVGAGVSIFFRKKGVSSNTFALKRPAPKPKIYFAQLGLKAKLQGLTVLEMLRRAKIPVEQSFDPTRLSIQLKSAQEQGVLYLLIMGQREALDGTVIVRSMQNSAQTTVMLSEVPKILKTLC